MTDQLKRAISAAKTAQSNTATTNQASSGAEQQNFEMSESSYKTSHTAVRKARRFAMQGLYEWLVTDHRFDRDGKLGWKANAPHDIAARTRATNAMHTVHIGYYHEMMRDIPEQIEALDALISQHLDREIDKLDTVEHAILLIGAYELQNRLEIPYKVVLDEAMKLNNHFGATDAHKLINAVLDRMAVELRDAEVQADTKANLRTSQKAVAKSAETITEKDTPEGLTNEETTASDSQPAKPRISANKTNVKRNRSNKANTGISDFKANAKNVVQDTVEIDSTNTAPADNTNEIVARAENVVNDKLVEENVAANNENGSNENTTADIGLSDSNIVSTDVKENEADTTESDSSALNHTDPKSQD